MHFLKYKYNRNLNNFLEMIHLKFMDFMLSQVYVDSTGPKQGNIINNLVLLQIFRVHSNFQKSYGISDS